MAADDKSPLEWRSAPEVAELARDLITRVAAHHDLVNAHIEYVFRSKASKSRGHETWGKARKPTGLQAWLANPEQSHDNWGEPMPFFIIEIAYDVWQRLDDNGRMALVDHELCHCAVGWDEDGDMQLSMRHHDVEEFLGVISRNGLWRESVQEIGRVSAEQLQLAFDRAPDPVKVPLEAVAAELGGEVGADGAIHVNLDNPKPKRRRSRSERTPVGVS